MSFSRISHIAAVTVAAASLCLIAGRSRVLAAPATQAATQVPATPAAEPGNPPPPAHTFASPTNLKVLPRNLTGEQVHEIMEKWEGELGTGCKTCHAASKELGPNGRPRLNFADDSKQEKQSARLMYQMTEKINADYVSKVDNSGAPVTCGTCHRGHFGPEPFVPAKEPDHDHAH